MNFNAVIPNANLQSHADISIKANATWKRTVNTTTIVATATNLAMVHIIVERHWEKSNKIIITIITH